MINIDESGIVTVLAVGTRSTIEPGNLTRAAELLTVEELATVRAAWTETCIAAYTARQLKFVQSLPPGVEFSGSTVRNADDVDRVTAARISSVVAPGLTGDVALLRQLSIMRRSISLIRKDATGKAAPADKAALAELETLDAQVSALIAEGDAFKKKQGWS